MGRNTIPKLDEWRDGELYRFRHHDGTSVYQLDDGKLIVYTFQKGQQGEEQVLATAFADGSEEVMAAMYEAGIQKGKLQGALEARKEILRALGIEK